MGVIRGGTGVALLALAVAAVVPAPAQERRPLYGPRVLPDSLPAPADITDPVFSLLIGMVEGDLYGLLTHERLEREIAALGRPTQLPIDHIRQIRRDPGTDGRGGRVRVLATGRIDLAVPYRVLLYHPGSFRASPALEMTEWNLGTVSIADPQGRRGAPPIVLEDVRLWGLARGEVLLDVDGWLDRLLGRRLDDTHVVGFALFRYEGERVGMAMGYNRSGEGRSGTFSFRMDRILFPNPPPMRVAGAHLRGRLEMLMPSVRRMARGDG